MYRVVTWSSAKRWYQVHPVETQTVSEGHATRDEAESARGLLRTEPMWSNRKGRLQIVRDRAA